jgi:hypothetical protein
MTDRFTAYITRNALTTGIQRLEVEGLPLHRDLVRGTGESRLMHYHKGEWHRSIMEAKITAEKMRKGEIERLRKEIARLEEITF